MPTLNRRGFLQSLSAAGLVPFMPALPAAATPVGHTSIQYVWASYFAKANNACSVPQIMSALNVPPEVAESLMQRMIKTNVLTPPSASGVARLKKRGIADQAGLTHAPDRKAARTINLDKIMQVVTRNIAAETRGMGVPVTL